MIEMIGGGGRARGIKAIEGHARAPVVDHRDPLTSPVTVLVMLVKAAGFRWYGPEKALPNGGKGTSCFLNTTSLWADGTRERKVVWAFIADRVEIGGDLVSIWQMCAALGYGPGGVTPRGEKPIGRGAATVLTAVRSVVPWDGEMPFNARGRALLDAAARCGNLEGRRLIADAVELYRGYVWKLSMPIEHPPHPEYGYPLDCHYRFRKGKRTGDLRQSICRDERMEEMRVLGLR